MNDDFDIWGDDPFEAELRASKKLRGMVERGGVLHFAEFEDPTKKVERRRFNWRNFAFWAMVFAIYVISQVVIHLAVMASA